MIVISYSLSLKALDQYIKNYNAGKKQLGQHVRQGISSTAKDIIRIYGHYLSKFKPEYLKCLDKNDLPVLRTNNHHLAQIGHVSPRTIQRHIKRLLDAGIITHKVFRGSKSNYELRINPQLLLVSCEQATKQVGNVALAVKKSNTENQLISHRNTSRCPHRDSGNNNTNIIKAVESVGKLEGQPGIRAIGKIANEIFAGYTGEKVQKKTEEKTIAGNSSNERFAGYKRKKLRQKRKNTEAGDEIEEIKDAGKKVRKRTNTPESVVRKNAALEEVRSASLSLYVSLLWTLAKKELYTDVFLTDRQCEIAQVLIRQWYEPLATERLGAIHQVYVSRIGLVRKYLNKDPQNRFVQLPYLYFDVNNSSGFRGTKKWWSKQQERKIEVGEQIMVHRQIKKLLDNKNRDGSESTPPLKLYAECESRVRKLGNPELLQKFYTAISNQCTLL